MQLYDKFIRQLELETRILTRSLQGWWSGMEDMERLIVLSIFCTCFLLLALRRPRSVGMVDMTDKRYKRNNRMQFFAALTVIFVFSLGTDIIADQWR